MRHREAVQGPHRSAFASASRQALLLLGAVLATGLLLEAGARVLRWLGPQPLRFEYLTPDPLLGHRHRPGARERLVSGEYAIEMAINSRGLRGPERAYDRPPGTARILLLGDSFVEGLGVEASETAAAQLEAGLARGARVQVLNAGVADYCTAQEYLFYKTEGARYGARVVVLFFYMNDVGPTALRYTWRGSELSPVRRQRRERGAPVRREWSSAFLALARERLGGGAPRLYDWLAGTGLWPRMVPPDYFKVYKRRAAQMEPAWDAVERVLAALAEEVSSRDARLLLFFVPNRIEIDAGSWRSTAQKYGWDSGYDPRQVAERLQAMAARLHVPVLDATSEFARSQAAGRRCYFDGDIHWTAAGHRVAADSLRRFLLERGWLGNESGP